MIRTRHKSAFSGRATALVAAVVLLPLLAAAPGWAQEERAAAAGDAIEGLSARDLAELKQGALEEEAEKDSGLAAGKTPGAPETTHLIDLSGLSGDLEDALLTVMSNDSLDVDPKTQMIYGRPRTIVRYGDFELHADYMVIDVRLREVHAEGDVVLKAKGSSIKAEKMLYNFSRHEGLAYNVSGDHAMFHFHSRTGAGDAPTFRQLSREQTHFVETDFTTCDFPRPHYYIRAGEVTLFTNNRIFMRNVVIYIRDVPVMYLPGFTRSLAENQPWHFAFGRGSRLGMYVLGSYTFDYGAEEPDWEDSDQFVARSQGSVTYNFDYFQDRGPGLGLEHNYSIDRDRHKGSWEFYGFDDHAYEVPDDERDQRWMARLGHRSRLADRWWLHANLDYMSDPEVYYDVMDRKDSAAVARGRVAERDARLAVTHLRELLLARVLVGIKERVSRDHVTNFQEYDDDDRDFDEDPRDEGLHSKRYGVVSERYPQVTVSTSWIDLLRSRSDARVAYYHSDLNLINNLDKGLNVNSREDDAFVRGFDFYNQLMFYWRFGPRTNLIAKLGAGGGVLDREDDEFGLDHPTGNQQVRVDDGADFPLGQSTIVPGQTAYPGAPYFNDLVFLDRETFLVGKHATRLSDYEKSFIYGDADLQLNQRFTRALSGQLRYFIREGTDDSLSEWYEYIGNRQARNDLYDYRVRQHFTEARLDYKLRQPNFSAYLAGRENLDGGGDIYPNERLRTAAAGWQYLTPGRVFAVRNSVGYGTTQIRDRSHLYGFERDSLNGAIDFSLRPRHKNWWGTLGFYASKMLDDDPDPNAARRSDDDDFNEIRTRYGMRGSLFSHLGPKWAVDTAAAYEFERQDLKYWSMTFMRDIHDAVLNFELRFEDDDFYDDDADDNDSGSWVENVSFRFFVTFKLPSQDLLASQPVRTVLKADDRKVQDEN